MNGRWKKTKNRMRRKEKEERNGEKWRENGGGK